MKNKPLDFQSATAEHVLNAYKNNQKRVLVADEAGLGKTTVASEVVRRVKTELQKQVLDDDGLYCIVYVCCNLQIAQQNIGTLSDDGEKVDLSQSRLSMQHLVYHEKKANMKDKDTLVLSLTPATSFQVTDGTGSVDERALIYSCLTLLPEFVTERRREQLAKILVGYATISWDWTVTKYIEKVYANNMNEYRELIKKLLQTSLEQEYVDGMSVMKHLLMLCENRSMDGWKGECADITAYLRKLFANISLDVLKPDLVIMDEFQKFSSLISMEKETEENMIARKFFSNKDTFILLLSATPYKPYTTLEELNENNSDEQYKDFHRLLDFLYANHIEEGSYKEIWREYSTSLKHLDSEHFREVCLSHIKAEEMLYSVMGRTERSNDGIIKEVQPNLIDYFCEGDVASFIQMQKLIDNCRKFGKHIYSAPADYTKSTAYQLSFMDNYKLKDVIQDAWKNGASKGLDKDCLLLDRNLIEEYKLRNYNNAKLNYLVRSIFGEESNKDGIEQLLWVPASRPYYSTKECAFTRNQNFSKILAFSSWGMVPKMIATLLSYEVERRLYRRTSNTYTNDRKTLLAGSAKKLLSTVSVKLASLYEPEKYLNWQLDDIRADIISQLDMLLAKYKTEGTNRMSANDILNVMNALDGGTISAIKLSSNTSEILANIAIGSPALCLYRTFARIQDSKAIEHAVEVADKMDSIFNNRYGISAVRKMCKSSEHYFQNVMEYCVLGNMQSVIDEFVHMIGEDKEPEDITKRIIESFVGAYTQPVNTIQGFGQDSKLSMRKHFAVDFGSGKQTEKEVSHATNVRSAFNSPFRPFVLASTSVGQEGLDFHWYARKVVHWNLPSNPQNLEQREGRVNRYKCLAVRRNLAKLYKESFSWDNIFSRAVHDLKQKNSDMVPFWYLPLDSDMFNNIKDIEQIERIVPIYPLSEDKARYERLIQVLTLYRLTMGQPRQEELLQLLEGKVTEKQIKQLIFNLCPFDRTKNL